MKHDRIDTAAALPAAGVFAQLRRGGGPGAHPPAWTYQTIVAAVALAGLSTLAVYHILLSGWVYFTWGWATGAAEIYAIMGLTAWRARKTLPGSPEAKSRLSDIAITVMLSGILWTTLLSLLPHMESYLDQVGIVLAGAAALVGGVVASSAAPRAGLAHTVVTGAALTYAGLTLAPPAMAGLVLLVCSMLHVTIRRLRPIPGLRSPLSPARS